MRRFLTLSLDAMGGDFGPSVTVPASLTALDLYPNLRLFLVGNPDDIYPLLQNKKYNLLKRLTIIPTKLFISSDIKPSKAIRISRGTSMRIALELIKSRRAQGCISGGNTGALMGLSKLLLKPLDGIERPALIVVLPNQKHGKTVVLDLGANIKCDSSMLVQFAIMGSVFCEQIVGIDNPRVALLNIGSEEAKGLNDIYQAAMHLKDLPFIHYVGYLEANELLMGKVDVLVCDGFIGNIMLKTMEGIIKVFFSLLRSSNNKSGFTWLVQKGMKFLIKKRLANTQFSELNPDKYNGACLVGLRDIVVKSHGAADQIAFISAIEQGIRAVEYQIPNRIASRLVHVLSKL